MEGLSEKLKLAIEQRPTLTLLRGSNIKTQIQFDDLPKTKIERKISLPEQFDGKEVWKKFLSPIRNQGTCGSCWAFASTSALSDRFNIQSLGKMKIELSPTKMVLCENMVRKIDEKDLEKIVALNVKNLLSNACHGNTLYNAWRFLYLIGSNEESCMPYNKILGSDEKITDLSTFTKDSHLPICSTVSGLSRDMCSDFSYNLFSGDEHGTPARFYRCLHFYTIAGIEKDGGNESFIRHDIFAWGPVTTGIVVYPDFYLFDPTKDVYEWNGIGDPVGGHAIELVGWGVDKGKPFWWVKNSWGEKWGINGYFKMARGKNTCKIEENVIAGEPDFFYPKDFELSSHKPFTSSESKKIQKQRRDIDINRKVVGGGIDPETGFTRRVQTIKPWLITKPPIDYKNLPDWNTFIAGKIAVSEKNNKKYWIIGAVILAIVIIIVIILYKKIK